MTEAHRPDTPSITADWVTIWQSELAAMALDREAAEAWSRLITRAAEAACRLLPDDAPGRAGAAAPPGAAAALAASDAALTRLEQRVAALEHGQPAGLADPRSG